MTDEINDFDFDDAETTAEGRPWGLVVPTPLIEGDTIERAEDRFRKAKQPFATLFTASENEDDENGPEIFDDPADADRMRVIMGWPDGALPTVAEAEAWQARQVAIAEWFLWQKQFGPEAST